MLAHILERAPILAVGIAAELLAILSLIGLVTEFFSVGQIVGVALVLVIASLLLAAQDQYRHR